MELIQLKNVDGVVALKLEGRLDLAGVAQVEEQFKEQTALAVRGLLLDCTGLSFLASLGMRMLMQAAKSMQGRGGKVVLAGPQEEVENALRMSGLDQVMPIAESIEAAQALLG